MERVLFIMLPIMSHVIAVLGVARILSASGFNVCFAGGFDKRLVTFLQQQGFASLNLNGIPFGLNYSTELTFYKKLGKNKVHLISDRIYDQNFHTRKLSLETLLDEFNPSYVILDSFISSDFLCLYQVVKQKRTRFCFINTQIMFSEQSLPPANSCLMPGQKLQIRLAWLRRSLAKRVKTFYQSIFLLGNTTEAMVKKKMLELNLPSQYKVRNNYPLHFSFTSIKELVTCPVELDFPGIRKNPDRTYIGSFPLIQRTHHMNRQEYDMLFEWLHKLDDIVYLSFGTLSANYRKQVAAFLRKMVLVSQNFKTLNFIVSNVSSEFKHTFGPVPENVAMFGMLPQPYVLSKAKIFITHGGTNSIRESIYFKVPMLVYPLNPYYDHRGNAARVVFHKMGLLGDMENDSVSEITSRLSRLYANIAYYKRNVANMKDVGDKKYTESNFLKIFKEAAVPVN